METLRHHNPEGVAAPLGRYSHLVTIPAGRDIVMLSGQVGMDPAGTVPPDAYRQTHQVFANIGTLLASAGAQPQHVIRLLTFVAGAEHLADFRLARDEVYAAWYPNGTVPAATLAVVAGLAAPHLLVEVEAMAALP